VSKLVVECEIAVSTNIEIRSMPKYTTHVQTDIQWIWSWRNCNACFSCNFWAVRLSLSMTGKHSPKLIRHTNQTVIFTEICFRLICYFTLSIMWSWVSSAHVVTRLWAVWRRFRVRFPAVTDAFLFFIASRPAVGPTQSPVLIPLKWLKCEADHLTAFCAMFMWWCLIRHSDKLGFRL
jgi:hypothetical protein